MFTDSCTIVLDLVPHCASSPRETWSGDDDLRPLSERGTRQAAVLGEVFGAGVDAVYSSPALRCRQSVAPLAAVNGTPVLEEQRLREARGFAEPAAWTRGVFEPIGPSLGGAWAAGRVTGALVEIAARHRGGHVVACSHGDAIPAVLVHMAAAHGCELPEVVGRGGWYRLRVERGGLSMTGMRPTHTA
ncbi:histidine phosphatase family protein [Streptomyces sp. TG1A-8]|uniref:histidine phosphatase family protein n=1 Tax=Streptomyces sp. TG1A-8 TaxID=3051385 RepID=UPI00265BA9D4|nr:histidine phosphatase family protein [Streptomyces sp. TG1A-8]MDO0925049.1 histidine phosphatase family protein [Streptomyces sp. TG1A-8]